MRIGQEFNSLYCVCRFVLFSRINLYPVHSLCGTSTGIQRSEWKASYVGTSTAFVLQLGHLQFSQCRLSLCWHFGQVKVRIRDFRRYVGLSSLALHLSVQCCSLSLKLSSDVLCIRGVWCSPNVNIFEGGAVGGGVVFQIEEKGEHC